MTRNVTSPTPGSMIPGLMQNGLSSITQNPLSAVMTQATAAISTLTGQLGGGSTPLTLAAVTALGSSLNDLNTSAAELSGAQLPAAGAFGLSDLGLHFRTAYLLGSPPPDDTMTPATAAAPLTSSDLVNSSVATATTTVASLLLAQVDDADAATAITALSTALEAVIDASDAAISGLRSAVPALSEAAAIGGGIAAAVASVSADTSYSDPNMEALDALYQQIVQPAAYAALRTAALAAFYVPPPVLGPMAPTMPLGNVALRALVTITPSGGQTVEVI